MIKTIRIALGALGFIFILVFIGFCPSVIFNAGSVLGIMIGVLFILTAVFEPKIDLFIKKQKKNKSGRILLSVIGTILIVGISTFSITLGSIFEASVTDANKQNTLIVLGCSVQGDNPSLMLKERISTALKYLQKNKNAKAILSGGQGKDENLSEAQCMYNILVNDGISPDRLIIEDSSATTNENIKNSTELIKKNNLSKDIAIVTSDFHQKRAKMICHKYGLNASSVSAHTPLTFASSFYLREVLGVIKEFVFH
jgi:uncharacterized SAM-binding protein YcdF (DUF218 family)